MGDVIRSVAVIGAGVMGAGIAAHCANAGIRTLLLDIVPEGAEERNALALKAIERLKTARPAAFAAPEAAGLVIPGNTEDNLADAGACDLVIEAVIEDLAIKRDLYRRLAEVRSPHTVISSNTSTLPLAELTAELPEDARRHFMVTHFFNPPRYMRLVEVVAGPETDPEAALRVQAFCERFLGKRAVVCRDRPGFIANRLGTYWMVAAANGAVDRGISVEDADACLGKPFGIPPTGIFGLLDLVGIDLMGKATKSMYSALAETDPFQKIGDDTRLFDDMTVKGLLGRKSGGGFYRQVKGANGEKLREVLDLRTMAYRSAQRPDAAAATVTDPAAAGPLADYAWTVMARTLAYACTLVPDVTDSPAEVDAAMTLGYAWREGPFALIDRLGPDRIIAALKSAGEPVPDFLQAIADVGGVYWEGNELRPDGAQVPIQRPAGVVYAADFAVLRENGSAILRDMGDGIGLFVFRTKMNTFDKDLLDLLRETIDQPPAQIKALVIGNDAPNFSAGADLKTALSQAEKGEWDGLIGSVQRGQEAFLAMKYGSLPVIGACTGLSLGGGCEILMHCHAVQAHLETHIGLVEANVGLIPAWGGTTQTLVRKLGETGDFAQAAVAAFRLIAPATLAASAAIGRNLGYLPADVGISMNRDQLLADAKARALALATEAGRSAAAPLIFRFDVTEVRAALSTALESFAEANPDTPWSVAIARELAWVLVGGDTCGEASLSEADFHGLERSAFRRLCGDSRTRDRMRHTLETGKPLRN
ncbi:3-hydroxyacyl-CoA dehydrogenase NAD-binding domain-containing protein [uncultured Roseibium sp.]|uniref:3-hydroxyacyl-CoA dehydrogenase/enoyl-CoA hydratase family protein n=1 Tax=uncultured Roseibium sp. TaxID=1936171 RepID=UPI003217D4B6